MENVLQAPTIMLIQPSQNPQWRMYSRFYTVKECLEVICGMYEDGLRQLNPNAPAITYTFRQLFDFIDGLEEIVCLVYRRETNSYVPCNKDWIKEKIYELFRRPQQQYRRPQQQYRPV